MVDYSSLNLEEIYKKYEMFLEGKLKKKDIMDEYNLNQHSFKKIKEILENQKEKSID